MSDKTSFNKSRWGKSEIRVKRTGKDENENMAINEGTKGGRGGSKAGVSLKDMKSNIRHFHVLTWLTNSESGERNRNRNRN